MNFKKHLLESQQARLKEKRERNRLNKMVNKRNKKEARQEVQNKIYDMITTLKQRHLPCQEIVNTINDMVTSLEDGSEYPFQKNMEKE